MAKLNINILFSTLTIEWQYKLEYTNRSKLSSWQQKEVSHNATSLVSFLLHYINQSGVGAALQTLVGLGNVESVRIVTSFVSFVISCLVT